MIEKRTPRKLNKSVDSRLIPPTDMSDAINISFTEDSRGEEGGNTGVLKPIKSNEAIDASNLTFSDSKKYVIGKCVCNKYDVAYFFVHDPGNAENDGIYAYDPYLYLPVEHGENEIVKIFSSSQFDFSRELFVKADITYIQKKFSYQGKNYDDSPMIFFTDNKSEPKKLNVLRASTEDSIESEDFILACPKTPVFPITGEWGNDDGSSSNEFIGVNGFQFAYQAVYLDGNESAISTYSDVFVPPAYLNYTGGDDLAPLTSQNKIILNIPNDDLSSEVKEVKLLVRKGEDSSWFLVDKYNYSGDPIQADFSNTTVNAAIPRDVQSKQFDNLPKIAEAQTIIDNRLVYGNYVDGFDRVETDAFITQVFNDRPEDFRSYDVKVNPCTVASEVESIEGAQNKNIGFVIDGDSLPDGGIEAGSVVNLSFIVTPEQNWHIYNSEKSYHQSPQLGNVFSNRAYVRSLDLGAQNTDPDTGAPLGFFWQDPVKSGSDFIIKAKNDDYPYHPSPNNDVIPAVCNDGCNELPSSGGDANTDQERWKWESTEALSKCDIGTSAANPIIIKGGSISLKASFKANIDLTKEQTVRTLSDIISGKELLGLYIIGEYAAGIAQEENISVVDVVSGIVAGEIEPPVDIIESTSDLSYSFNLGLTNTQVFKDTNPLAKLISVVGSRSNYFGAPEGGTQGPSSQPKPLGFYIVNKATVRFGIFEDADYNNGDEKSALEDQDFAQVISDNALDPSDYIFSEKGNKPRARFGIYISSVEFDSEVNTDEYAPQDAIVYCARRPWAGSNWFVFTEGNGTGGFLSIDGLNNGSQSFKWRQNPNQFIQDNYHSSSTPGTWGSRTFNDWQGNVFGFERELFEVGNAGQGPGPWHFVFGKFKKTAASDSSNHFVTGYNIGFQGVRKSKYSLMDGAGGPGGQTPKDDSYYGNLVIPGVFGMSSAVGDGASSGINSVGSALVLGFHTEQSAQGDFHNGAYGPALSNNINIFPHHFVANDVTTDPTIFNQETNLPQTNPPFDVDYITTLPLVSSQPSGQGPVLSGYYNSNAETGGGYYEERLSNPNAQSVSFYVTYLTESGGRSFKSGANHSFGVVYYDERGRASNVNPLGSVYVPWFSSGTGGSCSINVQMNHEPPEYAKAFQFVYSGNTTKSRFVQYSTGGAFIIKGEEDSDSDSGNILVSLNYLQDNENVSFAKAKGARSVEGSQDIYTFREGDKLKIISYYSNESVRSFVDYEFNVVGQRVLSEGDDNPLVDPNSDENIPHPAKTGTFLVLENNPGAIGFTYQDVKDGNNAIETSEHYWNNRCVVEVYSPMTSQDEESLIYYESSNVYPISEHQESKKLTNGDVWWRRVAVNMPNQNSIGVFENIIQSSESTPIFKPYYLESQAFNETVRNSDVNGKGKFKSVVSEEQEVRRSSSITYSEKNNPASSIFTLTSFNPAKGQFKDLPMEFGQINYIANTDDSIFVIQSSRCSSIPVNRNLITDLGSTESLVASKEVLGTERYYAGTYGCDNNPESVCEVDTNIYFASKGQRQVYRFNPSSGITVISDSGMKSYFRKLFEAAEKGELNGLGKTRVVGGYDPHADSFILSIYNIDDDADTVADPGVVGGDGVEDVTSTPQATSITINSKDLLSLLNLTERANLNLDDDGGVVQSGDLLDFLSAYGQNPGYRDITIDLDSEDITVNYEE